MQTKTATTTSLIQRTRGIKAAIDLQHSAGEGAYITEQQINNHLIANHEPEEGEEERVLAARQKYEATRKRIFGANAQKSFYHERARASARPNPVPVHTPEKHDWDFFYCSLQASPEMRRTILAKMCSSTTPVFKSELRTQRATTLSDRIGKKQQAMPEAVQR